MRAVSENPALAEVAGIDVGRVVRATWLIGGALACAAGVMAGITVQIRPYMGFDLLLPLFSAAILGGIGSVPGAVLGGLIVGVAQSGAVHFAGAEYPRRDRLPDPDRRASGAGRPASSGRATDARPSRLRRVLPGDGADLRRLLPRPQSAMGTDGALQCRRRRLRGDRRLHVGAADDAGDRRALRRLRHADRRRLARGDGRVGPRRGADRRDHAAPPLRLSRDRDIRGGGLHPASGAQSPGPDRRPLRHRLHPPPVRLAAGRMRCRSTSPTWRWSRRSRSPSTSRWSG